MTDEPSELDIHTEEAGDQSGRHQHQRDQGEHLHDLVLVEVDDTEYGILKILQTLETEVGMIDKRRNVLEKNSKSVAIFLRIACTLENA